MQDTKNNLQLKATLREELGKKVKHLRKNEMIPAVLYGHGIKNKNLTISESVFNKLYKEAGDSSLFDVIVGEDKPVKAIIQKIQTDPLSDKIRWKRFPGHT